VAFADVAAGTGLTEGGVQFRWDRRRRVGALLKALPESVGVVYVVGARPGGDIAGYARWSGGVGGGARGGAEGVWSVGARYLHRENHPVSRYSTPGGRVVEVHRAEPWFGGDGVAGTPYSLAEAVAAWRVLADGVSRRFDRQRLYATPGTTGKHLFQAVIPWGTEYPVPGPEIAELLWATAGQGRVEGPLGAGGVLPGLVALDGRFMYAALCRGLPVGPGVLEGPPAAWTDAERYLPARYRVRFRVPAGWDHVGLLGVRGDGWWYPRQPGYVGETWCDGAELLIAERYGWVDLPDGIVERIRFDKGAGDGPLGGWARRIIDERDELERRADSGDLEAKVAALVRGAWRNILIHAIGGFFAHGHPVTLSRPKSGPMPRDIPSAVTVPHPEGNLMVWTEHRPPAWAAMCHPEWSAAVWARARARLLSGPGNSGALHLAPDEVVALWTDAIYATVDPGWPDDGRPGRLRAKQTVPGPLACPTSLPGLLALIREAK
jgi:hypothetical protein